VALPAVFGCAWVITRFALGDTTVVTERTGRTTDRIVIHANPSPIRIAMTGLTGRLSRSMVVRLVVEVAARTTERDQRMIDTRAGPAIGLVASAAITDSLNMIA